MFISILFGLIGGLGLFLFGMNMMASGMQKAAGNKLRRILELLTSNPYMATLTGILVTIVVQSSSTTSVMVVGFTNSGLMGLSQALGTMLGASIGTTITAQLISFDFSLIVYPLIGVGVGLHLFGKKRLYKSIGQSILGFTILFVGLEIMSEAMHPLRDYEFFHNLMVSVSSAPILGVLIGTIFTALIQSSSATSGVVIAMTLQGTINAPAAIALMLGANIGTTITAALASIGTNITARRSVLAIFLVKVLGTIVVLILFHPFLDLVSLTSNSATRVVANAHTIFNVANVLLFIPLMKPVLNFVVKVIPGEDLILETGPRHLNDRILSSPVAALEAARQEVLHMSNISRELVDQSIRIFLYEEKHLIEGCIKKEELIDSLEKEIVIFLNKLAQSSLSKNQTEAIYALMHISSDVERIGDHGINIIRMAEIKMEEQLKFSEVAIEELVHFHSMVDQMLESAIEAFVKDDVILASQVILKDDEVDAEERNLRKSHIERLKQGICLPHSGILFLDVISNLERVGDHSTNLAEVVTGEF